MNEIQNQDEEYIKELYERLLEQKGIILTKPFNNDRRQSIYEILKKYPNVRYFPIGDGEKRQIVLRYKLISNKPNPVKKLLVEGDKAYKEKHYCRCINKYLAVLSIFNWPHPYVYARLGLAYMKIWRIDLAIDYLTVADYLYKRDNLDKNFTELLLRLKGTISFEDSKSKTRFRLDEFEEPKDEINFDEINKYIIETGLDVETACRNIGMNPEEIDILKLTYAREYLKRGDNIQAESFLKSFSKNLVILVTVTGIFILETISFIIADLPVPVGPSNKIEIFLDSKSVRSILLCSSISFNKS